MIVAPKAVVIELLAHDIATIQERHHGTRSKIV